MIRLPNIALKRIVATKLLEYQAEVNAVTSYKHRVAEGKRLFSLRNTASNSAFKVVRATLETMCSGARRCCYCEDSCADEVEHIRPKDLYPELVFAWENYLYACGPCNGPKQNKFHVFHRRHGPNPRYYPKARRPSSKTNCWRSSLDRSSFGRPTRFSRIGNAGHVFLTSSLWFECARC